MKLYELCIHCQQADMFLLIKQHVLQLSQKRFNALMHENMHTYIGIYV